MHAKVLQQVEDGGEPEVLDAALAHMTTGSAVLLAEDAQPQVLRPAGVVEGEHKLAEPRLRLAEEKDAVPGGAALQHQPRRLGPPQRPVEPGIGGQAGQKRRRLLVVATTLVLQNRLSVLVGGRGGAAVVLLFLILILVFVL